MFLKLIYTVTNTNMNVITIHSIASHQTPPPTVKGLAHKTSSTQVLKLSLVVCSQTILVGNIVHNIHNTNVCPPSIQDLVETLQHTHKHTHTQSHTHIFQCMQINISQQKMLFVSYFLPIAITSPTLFILLPIQVLT